MQSFGRYEIIEQLGQGSMGTVYRARDPIMDRDVAIKRIVVHAVEGPEAAEFRERFFREARAAGRLTHPGIVTVFDVSEHEGTPFLVMEYVAGRTLQSILLSGERMDMDRVRDLAAQLADALAYAHENGVIHRDIKPANILVTNDDRIKIADFGVAKLIESQLTVSGRLLGTPAFMAPEQFTGMPLDRRADLFAAGVVLYFMATGDKPFAGDTVLGVQYRVVHTDPLPPRALNPAISKDLEAVILKSIEKDPARRYQSGEDLARDLRASLAGRPVATFAAAEETAIDRTVVLPPKTEQRPEQLVGVATAGRRVNILLIVLIPFLLTFIAYTTVSLVKGTDPRPAAIETPPNAMAAAAPTVGAVYDRPSNAVPASDSSEGAAPVTAGTEVPPAAVIPDPEYKTTAKARTSGSRSAAVKAARNVAPQPIDQRPVTRPPAVNTVTQEDVTIGSVGVTTSPPPFPPSAQPLPPSRSVQEPVPQAVLPDQGDSHKSARLLIASSAMPEPLSIIVNVDNEMLFTRTATAPAPFGFEDLSGRIRLQSVPTVALSEERPIPPGKHKIQVNVLLGTRRVAKVQELTERFYSGQPRVLQIEFLPESQGSGGRDSTLFKIKLR